MIARGECRYRRSSTVGPPASDITDPTCEKIVLMLLATPGMMARTKKRALPDWLQLVFELDGYVFDTAGQIVRSSDALNSETTTAFI